MAGNLSRLIEDGGTKVEVQDTTFSIDVLGRYICSTWDEAVNNGGAPFDAVVIGAGMFGAYAAEKLYRHGKAANLRVLVLDAGSYLVAEHVQNLPRIGLGVPTPTTQDQGQARERVWGLPWRSAVAFPGLAYCVGGRSLYWGGWSPRLTAADLAQWPTDISAYLQAHYNAVEREIGVDPDTDYISGPLYQELLTRFTAAQPQVPTLDAVEAAPLAVQGVPPASGLFSFDKFSSGPILIDAIREAAGQPDATRRLFLVPKAHVTRLQTNNGRVTGLELTVNGLSRFLAVQPSCAVILANSTIEATRLALESFPVPKMGANLMAHLRSNTVVRIKRSAFDPGLPVQLEAAALLVRGSTPAGRYHLQVTAAAVPTPGSNSEATMWQMVPDIELVSDLLSSQTSEWIVVTLRGIGEMTGDQAATPQNSDTSWMDLSPFEPADENGKRRAWVNLVTTTADGHLWDKMDAAAVKLAQQLAQNDAAKIQYFYDGGWQNSPPPPGKVRDGLGTTHHEAGTLWMGETPNDSITDLNGRFHHLANAYVAGPALFPTLGSANPSLTALALARRTADAIVADATPVVESGFTSLYNGALDGWQMAGSGRFVPVGRLLESDGGIGLLWYTPEQFADFVLKLEWRAFSKDDNSGVFLRFPALGSGDPANDWRLAVTQGYEVQIDDRGRNPNNGAENDPLHLTGAIYELAPATQLASRPLGQWNEYEIQAKGNQIRVILNGVTVSQLTTDGSRPAAGHVGLQNHHPGSRVQFRNIRIKTT